MTSKLKSDSSESTCSASLSRVRVSPQKLNLVASLIRGLSVSEALIQLQFSDKRISSSVRKLLLSAIASAENNYSMDIDRLLIFRVNVGKSIVMKRFRARARGRGAKIIKPYSNIQIVLKEIN